MSSTIQSLGGAAAGGLPPDPARDAAQALTADHTRFGAVDAKALAQAVADAPLCSSSGGRRKSNSTSNSNTRRPSAGTSTHHIEGACGGNAPPVSATSSELIREIGRLALSDERIRDADWEGLSVAAIVSDGAVQVGAFRYDARGNPTPSTPCNFEVGDCFEDLQQAMSAAELALGRPALSASRSLS